MRTIARGGANRDGNLCAALAWRAFQARPPCARCCRHRHCGCVGRVAEHPRPVRCLQQADLFRASQRGCLHGAVRSFTGRGLLGVKDQVLNSKRASERQYTLVPTAMTWAAAKAHCKDTLDGGGQRLAVPRNAAEMAKAVAAAAGKPNFWLGVTNKNSADAWTNQNEWVDSDGFYPQWKNWATTTAANPPVQAAGTKGTSLAHPCLAPWLRSGAA